MKKEEVIFLNSVFFVIGFILIFAVLGILLQTFLTHVSFSVMNILKIIGGVIIIIFGVILILSAKYIIPFFSTEHRIATKRYSNSFASSFIFGIAFALGWTPCVGAILGSIYILAATSPGISFLLLLAYSLGLGIPFLVFGAFISKASNFFKKIHKFLKYFNIVGGAFPCGHRIAGNNRVYRPSCSIPNRQSGCNVPKQSIEFRNSDSGRNSHILFALHIAHTSCLFLLHGRHNSGTG
jgi:cytochrome c biogenesis protein CcdA